MIRRANGWLAVCVVPLLAACEPDDSGFEVSCDYTESGDLAEGYWHLEAEGTRSGCSKRRLNGHLTIEASQSVAVHAMAQATGGNASGPDAGVTEADAFVQRIERADYLLSAGSLPSALAFNGRTAGSCVVFTVSEELEGGDRLLYFFEGAFDGPDRIRGEFTGEGPEDCNSEGSFTVRLE